MKKKALCVIGLLLLTGCGNAETATTTQITTATTAATTVVTEKATEKTTGSKTQVPSSGKKEKNQDLKTAASLATCFNVAMADEAAFDEFYPVAGDNNIAIEPTGGDSYYLYLPEGNFSNLAKIMQDNIAKLDIDLEFHYYADDFKPKRWVLTMDPESLQIYVYIVSEDDQACEVSPTIDERYK